MTPSVRPWSVPDLAVPTGTRAAELDRRAIREMGVPEAALMERAGEAAAALVHVLHPSGPVAVLAGKGNNGGDALVAARCLAAWGRRVRILRVREGGGGEDGGGDDAEGPDEDGRGLLHGWSVPWSVSGGLDDGELDAWLCRALTGGVVLDGILGTGIRGAPRGEAGRVLAALARCREAEEGPAAVVALDIPSGVDADTGAAPESAARAHVTVAFGWPKLGTLLHPGRARAGRLLAVEIGFPPHPPGSEDARLLTPAWAAAHRPRRDPVTHKNRVGALAVVAGRPAFAGAAVLAARSALRSGVGYVRVLTHGENREVLQAALPEAVVVDAGDEAAVDEALGASDAVAVGPGMGVDDAAARLLERVLRHERPRVVDADALTLAAERPGLRALLAGDDTVVTPHPGEAGRLLEREAADVAARPLDALAGLRERLDCVVLLKGTPALVRGPGGTWVDAVATSDLATAGVGDTLTGCVGGLLAQGVSAETAAGLGLVLTARAGARAGTGAGLQSADIPGQIPAVLEEETGGPPLPWPGLLLDLDPPR